MDVTETVTRATTLQYCVCTDPDSGHEDGGKGACVFCDCKRFRAEALPAVRLL